MTNEQQVLLLIKGTLADAPPEIAAKIHEIANRIRTIAVEGGDEGRFALALVGADFAAMNP